MAASIHQFTSAMCTIKPSIHNKLAITAAVLLSAASPAFSSILIQEPFDYLTGSVGGTTTNATGLAGAWAAGAQGGTSTASAAFVANSLTLQGHFAPSGGSLELSNSGPSFGEGGVGAGVSANLMGFSTLYTSSVMQFGSPSGSYFNDWVVEQRFNAGALSAFGTSSGRNLVRAFASGSSANGKGGVSVDASEVRQGTGTNAPDTSYLLVTRYTVSGTDIVSAQLFTFDAASYANYLGDVTLETADTLLGVYASHSLTDTATRSLTGFGFLQYSINGGPIGRYDDFRLGTEIADVVNVVPEPSTAGLCVAGLLPLLRRRRQG